jgi:hypothetical protein
LDWLAHDACPTGRKQLYGLFALTYGVTQIAAGSQLRSPPAASCAASDGMSEPPCTALPDERRERGWQLAPRSRSE